MEREKTNQRLRYMVLAALFAAMVYVMTAFVHVPTHQGYVHIGDGVIFLAASILPAPYAVAASAIGAGLSDFLSGYAIWVAPTMAIKALTALVFSSAGERIIRRRNFAALIPAAAICVGGYYIAGALLALASGSDPAAAFGAALADVPTNLLQTAMSAALYIPLGLALDKMQFKSRLTR